MILPYLIVMDFAFTFVGISAFGLRYESNPMVLWMWNISPFLYALFILFVLNGFESMKPVIERKNLYRVFVTAVFIIAIMLHVIGWIVLITGMIKL